MTRQHEPIDSELYPLLSEAGRSVLRFMREHPNAPMFRNQSGNKLSGEDLARVLEFEREVFSQDARWSPAEKPAWLATFLEHALADVPHYRGWGRTSAELEELPTTSRADLSRDVAAFVHQVARIKDAVR